MALLSGVGLVLTLVFGCLLLALVAELYYLLWWKKQRITSCNSNTNSNSNNNSIELDYSNHTKEMFYLFCWDKPTTTRTTTHQNSTLEDPNPISNRHDPDLETGLGGNTKEESVEAELMRLHNLVGPPRFLFTIKEESKEDLESNIDAKSRTTSLSDFIVALDSQTPFLSPMNSPNFLGPNNNNNNINNDNDSGGGIKGMAWDYFFMSENMHGSGLGEIDEEIEDDDDDEDDDEEEEDDEDEDDHDHLDHMRRRRHSVGHNEEIEFKTPEKAGGEGDRMVGMETPPPPPDIGFRHIEHSNTAPPDVGRVSSSNKGESGHVGGSGGGGGGNKVDLVKVLVEIDDYFLKASECAQEVTKVLEAHKFQYHSNYADNRVPVDHAARVMRVITWNKALSMTEGGKDEFEDNETLATVLDKLMAWEKKLYEEVKAGELMKLEYQRKVGLLNKQKKRGAGAESVEKTKAAVSHLHTRYIVDMQSMDSTVAEVNELRDQQLYPKLVELVDEMAKMWENMCMYHDTQLQVATKLRSLEIMLAPRETTGQHHRCTIQLANVIQHWVEQFENMVNQQKHYVRHLHSWLKLNLIPLESSLKEKVSSPPRSKNPPIQYLLHAWHDSLEKLPDEVTKTAISSFGAVIKTIILHQEEEMKSKITCEEMRKEYLRKNQAFEDWYNKYVQRKGPEGMEHDRGEDGAGKDPVTEREYVVSSLKKRLEEELEKHQRQCVQVREKSLGTLKTRLPELFRALSEYAHACCDSYNKLRAIVLSQSSNGVSS